MDLSTAASLYSPFESWRYFSVMLQNTFSRNKRRKLWRINMAVSKCPCLTLSNVMLDAKISLVPTHQLIVPSTILALATNIRTYKDTKATKIRTGRLSTENGSAVDRMFVKWRALWQDIIAKTYNQHRGLGSRRPLLVTVKTLPNTKSNKKEI